MDHLAEAAEAEERHYEHQVTCLACSHNSYVSLSRARARALHLAGVQCGLCAGRLIQIEEVPPAARLARGSPQVAAA